MNDHAAVSRADGSVTFRLHTGDGHVTEPDFDLAERIDTIVAGYGSGG